MGVPLVTATGPESWPHTGCSRGRRARYPAPRPSVRGPPPRHLLDRWLLTRLDAALSEPRAGYGAGDLARTCAALTRLTEDDLSGLYLEVRKDDLYAGDTGALATLSHTLTGLLLALHPLLPFTTEELAEALGWSGLMDAEPLPAPGEPDAAAAAAGE
ncbi:hypothetical protein N866_06855 [Actinotalea ferrariae CF5-4]|uniref:Methionyl/Valyl/Leucyl/Isoleucyl-tRNA synthetase anticodon-binding domain-containing protein n=1 Tax=Actinotalea ferrariae CF5-4 TaxID=948458 RepID=A0A021VND4_9CELL|nr:hypothetical protein N866_06855 [Actinotalea ferrariae CF5-4]